MSCYPETMNIPGAALEALLGKVKNCENCAPVIEKRWLSIRYGKPSCYKCIRDPDLVDNFNPIKE